MSSAWSTERFAGRILAGGGATVLVIGLVLVPIPGFRAFGGLFLLAGLLLLLMSGLTFLTLRWAGGALGGAVAGIQAGAAPPAVKSYSAIEAMEMRGDYARAADEWRAEIAMDPEDIEARIRLAALCLKHLDEPAEAARLYREARDLATGRRRLGIELRLVDIYRDHLHDRGKTITELRRIVDTFPNAPEARGARLELERYLSELKEGS